MLEGEVENLRVRNPILMEMGKGKGEGGDGGWLLGSEQH